MNTTNKNHTFIYRVRSNFHVSKDFLRSEREFLRNSLGKRPVDRLMDILRDNENRKGVLVDFLVKKCRYFLIKQKIRETLLILFELDSRTDEEFDLIESMTTPSAYLTSLISKPEIYKHVYEGMV